MGYALFLGCTVPVRAQNYEIAARKVAQVLGIEFIDIPDFSCCGFPVKSFDIETAATIAARNIAIAEEYKLDICTLCSACTSVLTETNKRLAVDNNFKREINRKLNKLGKQVKNEVKVWHFARLLYENMDKILPAIKRKLTGIKLAAHYGCHYLRPKEIYELFDTSDDPKSLNELIEVTGATVVDYEKTNFCCGGSILGVDMELSLLMAGKKLMEVKKCGSDALVTICPFCSVMYEDNQRKVGEKLGMVHHDINHGVEFNLPVLYYPQVLGLALGLEPAELGFRLNKIKADELLAKLRAGKP